MSDDPPPACGVCGNEPIHAEVHMPATGVLVGYGRRCLTSNAHPYSVLVSNAARAGGYDNVNGEWWDMINCTLRQLMIPREKFDQDVIVEMAKQHRFTREMAIAYGS